MLSQWNPIYLSRSRDWTINAPKETYPLENYLDIESCLFIQMVKDRYGADNKHAIEKAFTALQHLARDHARIPMAWSGKARYGGFSEGAEKDGVEVKESWMKPHPLAHEINVASQLEDPDSVLAFWRKMLRFRKQHVDLLVYGDYRVLALDDPNIFTFVKETQDGRHKAVVALNFTSQERDWTPPDARELLWAGGMAEKLVPVVTTHIGKSQERILAPFEGMVYFATS